MKPDRLTRVNEELRRAIGAGLFRVFHEQAVDLSGITVTHVIASPDLKAARVLVSVRDPGQRPVVLALLQRHRPHIQQEISKNVILKYTPRLNFALDSSIEAGDRVLGILSNLDTEHERHDTDTDDAAADGGGTPQ